jgi:hypothetical protein
MSEGLPALTWTMTYDNQRSSRQIGDLMVSRLPSPSQSQVEVERAVRSANRVTLSARTQHFRCRHTDLAPSFPLTIQRKCPSDSDQIEHLVMRADEALNQANDYHHLTLALHLHCLLCSAPQHPNKLIHP